MTLRSKERLISDSTPLDRARVCETHKVAVFIDAANFNGTVRSYFPRKRVRYQNLRDYFQKLGYVACIYYYTPFIDHDEQWKQDGQENFFSMLTGLGYRVRSKPLRAVHNGGVEVSVKGNFDVELTADVMQYALSGKIDEIIIVSGDSDFAPLVQKLQDIVPCLRVAVIGSKRNTAHELRTSADCFIPLEGDLEKLILDEKPLRGASVAEVEVGADVAAGEGESGAKTFPE